ncbi:MAG: hypothetical protein DRI30_08160, partial [Chloroflexi bacterium]
MFVGREKEMDELRAGLEDALSGKGRLLMLVGEPGIGKTRTSEELATYAGLRNAQVLWGKCYEGEGAPAYWPWVQVIRSYVHDREPKELMSEMGPGAADIAHVVSEVKERLPGLPEPPVLEPEQARFRLFDSITTFLKNASKGQPIVLVLDDLHWADKPSLLLLQFLARELRGSRLMVLATYRDVELRRGHPLADALGELAREGLSQRILLRGLTDRDVARFIEITAGITPPEALVTAVYRETEGNPFFVNEIVRLLVADGRLERPEEVKSWSVTIPQGVREVVGRRLDHLSEDCNSVLTIASVIGREFGLDAMERVSDVTGDRLLEVLEEAVGARVVAEVPRTAGRYSFTHALIRETLYEELSTARRVRLHRQIGEVLEGLHREALDPHLAELAHHFSEAAPGGDVDKAIDYARRAGERAAALLAYEEAAELYGLALQALDLREATDEDQRCELMLARGEALNSAGSRDQARGIFEAAAGISRELGRPDKQARAALGFAGPWDEYGTADTVAITLLEEALAGLGSEDSTLRVRVLARLSWELFYALEREPSEECSRQALEIAQRVGDPRALGDALWRRQAAYHRPAEVQKRLQMADDLLQAARDSGVGWLAAHGHWVRMEVMMQLGDIQAVDVEIERHAQEAQESRLPSLIGFSTLLRALRALLEGRFEEAERLGREAFALGQRAQAPLLAQMYLIQLMILRWSQGRLDEMEALVRAGAQQSPDVPAFRATLAMTYADLGREEQAKVEFEGLAVDDFSNLPSDSNLPLTLAYLAVAADFLNDARRAAALYDLLLPYAGHNIIVGAGAACLGSASRSLGILATTMGRWEDAEKHFGDALEMNASMGARPLVAWTQHDHANMLLRRDEPGDREKALELVSAALDAAQ